jgi:adenylate cyclase
MVAKIFLVIGLVVGAALILQARRESAQAERALKDETREAAGAVARSVMGAVESTMLQGDGIVVKSLVQSIKNRTAEAEIHLYDPSGVEVFAQKPPPPDPSTLPAPVTAALSGTRHVGDAGAVYRPIPSDSRCEQCHEDGAALRGVLRLSFDDACSERSDAALAQLVSHGFVHVMTARREDLLDDYFTEIAERSPAIATVEVFDRDGDGAYGGESGVDAAAIRDALASGGDHAQRTVAVEGGSVELIPLVSLPRCVECHDDGEPMRGALAVRLAPAEGAAHCDEQQLEGVVDSSLRFIMLSRLGGMIGHYLEAAVATGVFDRLVLYDNLGRVYWDTRHPAPPPHVAATLESGEPTSTFVGSGDSERVRVVQPLRNEPKCGRCHGNDLPLRGAVTVSLSTAKAARLRAKAFRTRVQITGLTLVGILIILGSLLQYLVVRPVKRVAEVADAVGMGDLYREVERADPDGDEVAQLGARINAMVRGLRTKLQLQKLVSRGAVAAAEGAGELGISREGVRRDATILFSDIRGFTGFSEDQDAETVVAMLNRFLRAQADVVRKFDGDIDKFVGDELMALFHGTGAEERAVRCALEMIEAVNEVRNHDLSVGVGISCGQVVHGAVGHEDRLDFTVIGDAVNTGARLCAVAAGEQVLVTEAVREACGELEDIELVELDPRELKGKKQRVRVFEARRRG